MLHVDVVHDVSTTRVGDAGQQLGTGGHRTPGTSSACRHLPLLGD